MLIEFFVTSLVVILLPGTGVIYTIAVAISSGFRASIAAVLGCTLGIIPAATASVLGLATIFHTSAIAFLTIKYLGVAYLLYMAWNILQDNGALQIDEHSGADSLLRIAINGTLLNALNPKISLFFLAFLPQFIPATHNGSLTYLAYLAGLFMLLTVIVFLLYGAFASATRRYVINSPHIMLWLRRSFAATFTFLGVRLALAER